MLFRSISMHGEKGQVVVHTPNGEFERINYEEFGKQNSGRNQQFERKYKQTESTQEEQEEIEVQDAETCDTGERIVGSSERGREETCSDSSFSNHRILDRPSVEKRSRSEARSEATESLADEPTSSEWDVCSAFKATENEEEYDTQRRRSEVSEKEDQGIGRDYRDAGQIDSDSTFNAGMSRSTSESEEYDEEKGSEAWAQTQGTTESSRSRSEHGWFKKEDD